MLSLLRGLADVSVMVRVSRVVNLLRRWQRVSRASHLRRSPPLCSCVVTAIESLLLDAVARPASPRRGMYLSFGVMHSVDVSSRCLKGPVAEISCSFVVASSPLMYNFLGLASYKNFQLAKTRDDRHPSGTNHALRIFSSRPRQEAI